MKKLVFNIVLFVCVASVFSSCDSEERPADQPFVAAFSKNSYSYLEIPESQEIVLEFSKPAEFNGRITVEVITENCQQNVDFALEPSTGTSTFELPIISGQSQSSFVFQNLIFPFDNDDKIVRFKIVSIDYPSEVAIQGYSETTISFKSSLGGVGEPYLGGPNQGNQIYFDLSTDVATAVRRDSWDLGFYSGDDFRVAINSSIYMAVKKLDATDMNQVNQQTVSAFQNQVAIGTFDPANMDYVDAPNGWISGLAIDEISENDQENHVYLVNLGYAVGTVNPAPGGVAVAGNSRGWRKIRILRNADGYRLQYAEVNSATFQEVNIPKDSNYNFSFFSFSTNQQVLVEPEKDKWDLNFTVFTNEIAGSGSYGYSDFVLNNLKAGVKAYQVNANQVSFENYTLSHVNDDLLQADQRVIGADWRDVFTHNVRVDRFYVLKDLEGNYYKIRMLGFVNQEGVRGYPKFEYTLLQ